MKKTYSLIALALLCVLANCEKKAEETTTVTTESTIPGPDAGEIFLHRPENAAYELRLFSDQALLLEKPATAAIVTGFQNTL